MITQPQFNVEDAVYILESLSSDDYWSKGGPFEISKVTVTKHRGHDESVEYCMAKSDGTYPKSGIPEARLFRNGEEAERMAKLLSKQIHRGQRLEKLGKNVKLEIGKL